jgi:undecaprenyl-diphosphatase
LTLGLGALVLATIPALHREPPRVEIRLFRTLNGLPDGFYQPVWPFMQFGALAAVPVVAGATALLGDRATARRLAVGGAAAWGLAKIVKQGVGRGRPAKLVDGVRVRGGEATGRGFLSGHAAVATALAAGLVDAAPPLRPVVAGVAATVGLARVYVGAHMPLDILGGAALGLAVHAVVHHEPRH